jgi:hypothetical protein
VGLLIVGDVSITDTAAEQVKISEFNVMITKIASPAKLCNAVS